MVDYDIIIVGSGVAGLTAAIYSGRSDNSTLVIRGDEPGGQLTLTTNVENYPGFPEGISGPDLMNDMKQQAEKFGSEFTDGLVESVKKDGDTFSIQLSNNNVYTAKAVIAGSGASAKTLGIPGEDELMGFGVSTCATCDGAFFRGEDMAVVGGGDAAMEEASFLTKFASTVYIIHRRDEFRAEAYWKNRVNEHVANNEINILWNTEVKEIVGNQEKGVEHIEIMSHPDGHPRKKLNSEDEYNIEFETLPVSAVFIAIGHTPNTDYLEDTDVPLDETGYVKLDETVGQYSTETTVSGLFAAGDVFDYHYQQAVTAAGSGCKAAMDADDYLSDK